MGLSESQRVALAVLPKTTSPFSALCSSLIIYSILRDPKKRCHLHHRLLIGFSIFDISSSFWLFMSTWPIPAEASTMYASGNQATCSAQAFFLQLSMVPSVYNAVLAVYYLLVLRYGWTEEQLNPYEPLMQTVPVAWGFATASMGLVLRLYNNANLWCWIAPYPAGCNGDECIRGRDANMYRWMFYYGPLWACIIIVTVIMVLIYTHIWQQSKDEGADDQDPQEEMLVKKRAPVSDDDAQKEQALRTVRLQARAQRKEIRRNMAIQCALYTASFYITWVWLTAVRFLQTIERPTPYWILAAAACVTPAQGVMNFATFIFPRFFAAKASFPQAGAWQWLKMAI